VLRNAACTTNMLKVYPVQHAALRSTTNMLKVYPVHQQGSHVHHSRPAGR
jgi:hypothetical protein